jgi:hypothetical protein
VRLGCKNRLMDRRYPYLNVLFCFPHTVLYFVNFNFWKCLEECRREHLQYYRTESISTAPPVSGIANGRDVYIFLLPGFSGIEPVHPGCARYTDTLKYRFFGHHYYLFLLRYS